MAFEVTVALAYCVRRTRRIALLIERVEFWWAAGAAKQHVPQSHPIVVSSPQLRDFPSTPHVSRRQLRWQSAFGDGVGGGGGGGGGDGGGGGGGGEV